jgi:hypothetical protein
MITTYYGGYHPKPQEGPVKPLKGDVRTIIVRKRVLALRKANELQEDVDEHERLLSPSAVINGERRASFVGKAAE